MLHRDEILSSKAFIIKQEEKKGHSFQVNEGFKMQF